MSESTLVKMPHSWVSQLNYLFFLLFKLGGTQWLSGRVLDFSLRGHWFKAHWRHCVVSLSKVLYTLLSTGHPRKTRKHFLECSGSVVECLT